MNVFEPPMVSAYEGQVFRTTENLQLAIVVAFFVLVGNRKGLINHLPRNRLAESHFDQPAILQRPYRVCALQQNAQNSDVLRLLCSKALSNDHTKHAVGIDQSVQESRIEFIEDGLQGVYFPTGNSTSVIFSLPVYCGI